ncbi:MAG: hypothetical protein HWN69_00410 [Desulfobacterales bacterium]|nr:hypothetical protein [Desulfobacterales bacterium]
MSMFNLKLLFLPGIYGKDALPCGPTAYVAIQRYLHPNLTDSSMKNEQVISADCLTFDEFKHEINRLTNELETLKKRAERLFAEIAQEKQRAYGVIRSLLECN